jgi:hypothetical protein
MTTKVRIESPDPNHQDLLVRREDPETGYNLGENRLTDGQSIELHVYAGQRIVIEEVAKLPAEDQTAAEISTTE